MANTKKVKCIATKKCEFAGGVFIKEFNCCPKENEVAMITEARAKELFEKGYIKYEM